MNKVVAPFASRYHAHAGRYGVVRLCVSEAVGAQSTAQLLGYRPIGSRVTTNRFAERPLRQDPFAGATGAARDLDQAVRDDAPLLVSRRRRHSIAFQGVDLALGITRCATPGGFLPLVKIVMSSSSE